MNQSFASAFYGNFLGNSPLWYKQAIIGFLVLNPILLFAFGPFVAGWALIAEFIFTLAMALKCYPLQPGGLLALEAIMIGMATPETVYMEAKNNFEVILLLVFMVAGIYFMKNLLLFVFTKILLGVRSKIALSLMFSGMAALLSAFLDALTVTAVLITVGVGFYAVYHRVASGGHHSHTDHDHNEDAGVKDDARHDLEQFRAFLRSLLMHGAVGTALGGVCTLVGEPQNLLIAEKMGWEFSHFFIMMAPVSMPVLLMGWLTCIVLEMTGFFDYGAKLPDSVRSVLEDYANDQDAKRGRAEKAELIVQGVVAVFLVAGLALHLAPVGLIGLTIIVLQTAFNGVTDEHRIGHAFEEALPFTALLVVFFSVVGVIHEQHLFAPIIEHVLALEGHMRTVMFFVANGLLSVISDNVFVATVYINEVKAAFDAGNLTHQELEHLAVAINTGTNIPSVGTPNGQAAFLFLLTSALAPLIRLSYGKMVWMALPYTIVMSGTAVSCVWLFI
ncbi:MULTISPECIES: sodium/proton antiporter NhaB [Spongiibacter]|uniref:sodium/proton antiporter NhaB n=3 Tax=Spongiibacteraceae TaxID=1706375 RepID=UPI000C6817F5|nr:MULTISPECIES: sodium/proton antiporter NhaB [Spongiibacter]MAY38347.1 sodium/proton antiporter NhaB [Spongiibacter sp.]|tara:strand:+ start:8368 stop:9873 length:1506 start_codon:yes stop_codon:yes gene_type:complete